MQTKAGRQAQVFYSQRLAGVLAETPEGFQFTYDPDYLAGGVSISSTLPLRETPFNSERLPGFFENLASEGWLRRLQSQEQKIDRNWGQVLNCATPTFLCTNEVF